MVYYARIDGDQHEMSFEAKGSTEAEARETCLNQAKAYYAGDIDYEEYVKYLCVECLLEIAPGVLVPPRVAPLIPTVVPEGYGVLILERSSHSSGNAYDWRIFAVRCGTYTLRQRDPMHPEDSASDTGMYTVGQYPTLYGFLDSNSDYELLLPEGSTELVGGVWVPGEVAAYNY